MTEIEEEDLTTYFLIASDASNHGSSKMFPVATKFWTPQDGMQNPVKGKKKGKGVLLHAMEAHGGRGGIAPTHT
jgi:hypothetical protein